MQRNLSLILVVVLLALVLFFSRKPAGHTREIKRLTRVRDSLLKEHHKIEAIQHQLQDDTLYIYRELRALRLLNSSQKATLEKLYLTKKKNEEVLLYSDHRMDSLFAQRYPRPDSALR